MNTKRVIIFCLMFLFSQLHLMAQQNLWTVTYSGGNINSTGNGTYGTLIKYDPATNTLTRMYSYVAADGTNPAGTPIIASDGNIYGTTEAAGVGNAYGRIWKYNIGVGMNAVHSFSSGNGQYPHGQLIQASNGKLYGTAELGGANNLGTLFELDIVPTTPVFTKKVDLATATGSRSAGGLIQAAPNKILGVTRLGGVNDKGVIFEYDYSTNTYTKKIDLDGTTKGAEPWGAMIKAPNGKFYGMTNAGGTNNLGVIYEYDYTNNTYTVKQHLAAAVGANPKGALFIAGDGKMYGLTEFGGANNKGALIQFDYVNNTLTLKYSFDGTANGAQPNASLVEVDGRLYGTTSRGGAANNGTIFEYDYVSSTFTKKYEWSSHVYGNGFPFMSSFAVQDCPSVTITSQPSNATVCTSGATTFSVTATGTNLTYQWQVKSGAGGYSNISNNSTYSDVTTSTLTVNASSALNGNYYRCVISSASCSSYSGNGILTVTTDPSVTPSVSIAVTSGSNFTCSGVDVTFTATPTHGGTTPSYQWKVGSTNVGTNSATFTSSSLSDDDVITCVMTSNATCRSANTATSSGITMDVTATVTPAVSIAITTGSSSICAGSSVTFTATPTHGGSAPSYQWKVGSTNVGTGTTFTSSTLNNNEVVTCVMTSNATCRTANTATSSGITMTVGTPVTPSVSIAVTTGNNTTCSGSSVTFTATPVNGGSTPSYQWKKGSTVVGTNNAIFTSSTFSDNDVITCTMTTSAACASASTATSAGITMHISASVTPSVSIAVTSGSNTTCSGSSVTFTATPTHGGATPSYQWKVNNVDVATGVSFTSSTLTDGSLVKCVMTSNATCATSTTATSSSIAMDVTTTVTPTISIGITFGSSTTCSSETVTFKATTNNEGSSPSYQWYVNGAEVGINSEMYTQTGWTNNDVVTCELTSNATCASPATVTSSGITMHITTLATPTISASGSVLTSSALSGNQWYFEGNLMFGETGRNLNAFAPGNYTVTVTSGGCSATSVAYAFSVTSVNSSTMSANLSVYPNPSEGAFNIVLNNAQSHNLQLTVNDLYGSTVHEELLPGSSAQIDLSHLHKGVYFLHIQDGSNEGVVKVVIR